MSEQQKQSNESSETEKTIREEDNLATDPDLPIVEAQTDWQNPVDNGIFTQETAESENPIEENPIEWFDSSENIDFSGDDSAVATDSDKKIAELMEQLADTRDQLLRKAADFENFRKRMNQEKQSAIEFANQSLLLDIIPVIDDLERAIQSAGASEELAGLSAGKAMLDGIVMIEKRLTGQLEGKWGLKRFNSVGEPFDPNIHEAMFMEKSSDIEEPVVQEDFIKGYMLKDRVIRAAKVKVLMPDASTGE